MAAPVFCALVIARSNVRFGSLADLQHTIRLMSAFGGEADVRFEQKTEF